MRAAALAYLILHQQDSVGLVTFDSEIRALVRASSNPSHIKQLLQVHGPFAGRAKNSHRPDLPRSGRTVQEAGIVMVFSDLLDDVGAMMAGLKHFRHRRHEVILLHVLDPAEVDFPFEQPDAVSRPGAVARRAGRAARLRKAYLARVHRFLMRLKRACRMHGIDYMLVRTDQSLEVFYRVTLASRRDRKRTRCEAEWSNP